MNHINARTLLGLSALTIVAIVAATIISLGRKPVSDAERPAEFALPALRDHLNDVNSVTVTVAEQRAAVTLSKGDRGWTVKEKGGYPADSGKLRELLLKLSDARLLEQKTANEQRYPELGLEDIKSKDAKGVLISLEGLEKPAQLIVGNLNSGGNGTFVRRPEDKQSWLANGNITIARDATEWLEKSLVDIGPERIAEIILTHPGGKSLRLFKEQPTDSNYKVAELPKGRELASESTLNTLASTLADLTLSDVLPAQTSQPASEKNLLNARYRTFDGLTVEVQAWKQDDKHYARFSAVLDQAQADRHIQSEQTKAKADYEARQKADSGDAAKTGNGEPSAPLAISDPAGDRQQRLDQLNSEMTALNQRFTGWNFVIPPAKFSNMDQSVEDLLKPVNQGPQPDRQPDAKKSAKGKR